jgi:hypothetical protein
MRPIDPLLSQPPPGNTRWGGYENCLSFWFYCQNLVSVSVRTATYVVKIEQRIFWYSSQNSEPPCTTQLLQRPKSDLKFGWFLEVVRGFKPQNLDSTTPQKMVIWNVPGDQKVLEFWFELPVECGLRVVSIFAQIVLTANSVCVLPCNLGGLWAAVIVFAVLSYNGVRTTVVPTYDVLVSPRPRRLQPAPASAGAAAQTRA